MRESKGTLYRFIFTFFCVITAVSTAFASDLKVQSIDLGKDIGSYSSDFQHVLYDGKSHTIFLNEGKDLLLDFPALGLVTQSSRDTLVVGGEKFALRGISPVLISGLHHGEASIALHSYNNSGEKIEMTGNEDAINLLLIKKKPLITNDAVVLGILLILLMLVFYTSGHPKFAKFYKYVPSLLLCYFLPSLLNTFGVISGESSNLYFMSSRYLLPASLVLLTLSIDMKGIIRLGPKALGMFLAGTVGIMIGGPVALLIVGGLMPEVLGGLDASEIWRGLSTVAGSWIGGGANQTAMKEVFEVKGDMFSAMVTVDVIVANIWMAVILYGVGISNKIDKAFKADTSAIEDLKQKMISYQDKIKKIPTLTELMILMAVAFGVVAFAHFGSDIIAPLIKEHAPHLRKFSLTSGFFWLIVIATVVGFALSFTKARNLEGLGASKMGSLFLYVLVATIGMKMNVMAIKDAPGLFLVGIIWMMVHVTVLLIVGKIIKAPFFYTAVGSQANVGGAASAPIVASAFHPSLATVGVLLAVFGYAVGTFGAWACALIMQSASAGF